MALSERQKRVAKRYYEMTDRIFEQKLGLFHITDEYSGPEINEYLRQIEGDDARIEDFVIKKLDFSNAPKRFRSIRVIDPAKNKKPDMKMNQYLVEAFLCYVTGMSKACVALCRTAMEIGIKDQLNRPTSVNYVGNSCDELIREEKEHYQAGRNQIEPSLRRLIDQELTKALERKRIPKNKRDELKKLAHCVRIKGNIVIHSQTDIGILGRQRESLAVLTMTRNLLAELYTL